MTLTIVALIFGVFASGLIVLLIYNQPDPVKHRMTLHSLNEEIALS